VLDRAAERLPRLAGGFSRFCGRPLHVNLTKMAKVELFANVVAKNASFCFYFI
jgi:hypothetical protein